MQRSEDLSVSRLYFLIPDLHLCYGPAYQIQTLAISIDCLAGVFVPILHHEYDEIGRDVFCKGSVSCLRGLAGRPLGGQCGQGQLSKRSRVQTRSASGGRSGGGFRRRAAGKGGRCCSSTEMNFYLSLVSPKNMQKVAMLVNGVDV